MFISPKAKYEQHAKDKPAETTADGDLTWTEITKEIGKGNTTFVKTIITSNDIDINAQNPENGKTLLIYAVIIGNIDLVNIICNFGADVHVKDNDDMDALDYAEKYGQYKITELLYYRQLSGSLGSDMKNIAQRIHALNKQAKLMQEFKYDDIREDSRRYDCDIYSGIVEYMIQAIQQRQTFGEDVLYYAWYFVCHDKKIDNPLKSPLFKAMMKTYERILRNTNDKHGWKWLKSHFANSLIWYLPHPVNGKRAKEKAKQKDDEKGIIGIDDDIEDEAEDQGDKKQEILQQTLFWELLHRVRTESKKQSDVLLKHEIDAIQSNSPEQWQTLISYNVITKYSKNARQDAVNAIIPRFKAEDLSADKYPPSTHFDAKIHYDTNIYLNELLFQANVMDNMFQRDMKYITKSIKKKTGMDVTYRAGPVKTLARAKVKVENHYANSQYPTSAKILDINRCAIQFKNIPDMMKYISILTSKIKKKEARCLHELIRCKNGWTIYDPKYPQYTDIKLNILIQDPNDKTKKVIAELQFLLNLMSAFKRKAHKLYSVERKYEV